MRRVGLGASLSLIAIAIGIWLLGWVDARSSPSTVPWDGMCVLGAGLVGLILCVVAGLTGSALNISRSPQMDAQHRGSATSPPIDNDERTPTMSGKFDEVKGRAKEAAGDLTDNKDLQREGKTDQASGKVKQKVEGAKDWVEDKIDDVRDKAK